MYCLQFHADTHNLPLLSLCRSLFVLVSFAVGDQVEMAKAVKATVRVLPKHNEEAKKLLRLMGVPVVEAPTEAEAQCAELVRKGKAWATGTEDMDALTFGCPILLRYLTYSEGQCDTIRF